MRADDRGYAISRWGKRWSTAAIAAALAMPADTRGSAQDWATLIDRIEAGLRHALRG